MLLFTSILTTLTKFGFFVREREQTILKKENGYGNINFDQESKFFTLNDQPSIDKSILVNKSLINNPYPLLKTK